MPVVNDYDWRNSNMNPFVVGETPDSLLKKLTFVGENDFANWIMNTLVKTNITINNFYLIGNKGYTGPLLSAEFPHLMTEQGWISLFEQKHVGAMGSKAIFICRSDLPTMTKVFSRERDLASLALAFNNIRC
jgi:hypothetical protein